MVNSFSGRDATQAFISYHRRAFPHDAHKDALVGTTTVSEYQNDADYLELCAIVDKVLPRHKSFAPPSYFLKVTILLIVSFSLEFYMHFTGNYVWYLCAPLGWCMALIGLNVQHDANHGSVSRNPMVNKVLGLTQNWIGGSHIDWIHQHNVQHHVFCGDIKDDPDLDGSSFIRLNPFKPMLKNHALQHFYIPVMLAGFGFSVVTTSFIHCLKAKNHTKMSPHLKEFLNLEFFTTGLFYFRWFICPYLFTSAHSSALVTFLHISPMFMVAGFYLAMFFLISHNYEGVQMFDEHRISNPSTDALPTGAKPKSHSFLYRQVASSSNVGGPLLAIVNGGLNYQIEHHLFPRMSHVHYPTVAPIVKEYCKAHDIPYIHFPTVYDNCMSCIRHLKHMGNSEISDVKHHVEY